jgi:hypothetical protein
VSISNIVPHFSFPFTMDVLRWVPDHGISTPCAQEYTSWHQQAVDHELEHQRRLRAKADDINQRWGSTTAVLSDVCSEGNTADDAAAQLDRTARSYVAKYLGYIYADQFRDEIAQDEADFHSTNLVRPINCGACSGY